MKPTAVALLSGGMDSTTLAYWLQAKLDYQLVLLSVVYGQRHQKEVNYAKATAVKLKAIHHVVNFGDFRSLIPGSALTDKNVSVPHGHYEAASMKDTVVPMRNAFMLSAAMGCASAYRSKVVVIAAHAGDHAIYPDCRMEFFEAFYKMSATALEGLHVPGLLTPFVHMTKSEIAEWGHALGVDWNDTWSCYEGGRIHCGRCGTCCERQEAFDLAQVPDPTAYEDPIFWRTAKRDGTLESSR